MLPFDENYLQTAILLRGVIRGTASYAATPHYHQIRRVNHVHGRSIIGLMMYLQSRVILDF
jgi:hypothetical protein